MPAYKIIFKNASNPFDGVSIVKDGSTTAENVIEVTKTDVYTFEPDDPHSDFLNFTFRISFNVVPTTPGKQNIEFTQQLPRMVAFKAKKPLIGTWEYLLVADAEWIDPATGALRRGGSITGRRPIIRSVGSVSVLQATVVALLLFSLAITTLVYVMLH
jgi:hypothetical protein